MPRTATNRCRTLVAEAETQGACCFASNAAERRQLNRMVARGELARPMPGLFADAALWSRLKPDKRALMIIRGLARKHPTWVFCDMSAALVYGLWVSYDDARLIHVVASSGRKAPRTIPIVIHTMKVEAMEVNGVRVTTLERTVFDCCRFHPVRASLGVADAALRLARAGNAWLRAAFERFGKGNKGWRTASFVASIANGLAENGGESLARATMIMLGYQVPELQVEIENPIESETYRADFHWVLPDGSRVVGELDGHDKYCLPEMTGGRDVVDVLTAERLRESRINALRIPVMRFSLADVRSTRRFTRILDGFGIPRVKKRRPRVGAGARPALDTQFIVLNGYTVEFMEEYAPVA